MMKVILIFLMLCSTAWAQKVEVISDKVKLTKDELTFAKWGDNDAKLSIISSLKTVLKNDPTTGGYKQSGTEYDVKIYELSPADGMNNGGIEYEIVLPSKPSTNSFSFGISKNELEFYYQPELTQEEIDEGLSRPENVVGSYAVYHSSKRDNQYKVGKAFHIYRPKAFDKNGVEQWCEFNKDLNDTLVLTITCPQSFLDNAVYPVIIDPTIGDTDGGASCDAGIDHIGSEFILSVSADFTSVHANVTEESAGARTLKGAIWDDSAGNRPEDRLLIGGQVTIPAWGGTDCSNVAYVQSNLSAVTVTPQVIWIGFGIDDSGASNEGQATFDATASDSCENIGVTSGPQNPFGTCTHRVGRTYSVYATYTAAAPAGAIPDQAIIF